jgi:hypothetical protein
VDADARARLRLGRPGDEEEQEEVRALRGDLEVSTETREQRGKRRRMQGVGELGFG